MPEPPNKPLSRRQLTLRERALKALEKNAELHLRLVEKENKTLTAQGKAELEAIAAGHRTGSVPAYVTKQAELARILTETFQVEIPRQYLTRWEKEPGFPVKEKDSGRYHVGAVIEWCRVAHGLGGPNCKIGSEKNDVFTDSEVARKELHVIARDRERFELEKTRGLYITKAEHERAMVEIAKRVQPLFEQALEYSFPHRMAEYLENNRVSPELVAGFLVAAKAAGEKIVDEIKNKFTENA